MIKAIVKFLSNDQLNKKYEDFIFNLSQISDWDSVIDRKDNDDIWIEKEIENENKVNIYTITTEFTEDEIDYLKKNYDIEILEG